VTTNDSWRRYLETGAAAGQATVARAQKLGRGLLAPSEAERKSAWRDLEDLTRQGRELGEQLVSVARVELTKQLETLPVESLEGFLHRVADLVRSPTASQPAQPSELALPVDLAPTGGPDSVAAEPGLQEGVGDPTASEPEAATEPEFATAGAANQQVKIATTKAERKNAKKKEKAEPHKAERKKAKKKEKADKVDRLKKKDRRAAKAERKREKIAERPQGSPSEPKRMLTLASPRDTAGRT
jgi:hypothetical protein